jgi:hypothetical protein
MHDTTGTSTGTGRNVNSQARLYGGNSVKNGTAGTPNVPCNPIRVCMEAEFVTMS